MRLKLARLTRFKLMTGQSFLHILNTQDLIMPYRGRLGSAIKFWAKNIPGGSTFSLGESNGSTTWVLVG